MRASFLQFKGFIMNIIACLCMLLLSGSCIASEEPVSALVSSMHGYGRADSVVALGRQVAEINSLARDAILPVEDICFYTGLLNSLSDDERSCISMKKVMRCFSAQSETVAQYVACYKALCLLSGEYCGEVVVPSATSQWWPNNVDAEWEWHPLNIIKKYVTKPEIAYFILKLYGTIAPDHIDAWYSEDKKLELESYIRQADEIADVDAHTAWISIKAKMDDKVTKYCHLGEPEPSFFFEYKEPLADSVISPVSAPRSDSEAEGVVSPQQSSCAPSSQDKPEPSSLVSRRLGFPGSSEDGAAGGSSDGSDEAGARKRLRTE